jgi:hypothetical protein
MVQSVGLVCVEMDKQMPPQWHCPLSIVIGNPLSIRDHFSIQILTFDFIVSKIKSFFLTSIINLNFEFRHTRLHPSSWPTDRATHDWGPGNPDPWMDQHTLARTPLVGVL